MTLKDYENRLKNLIQRLRLTQLYPEQFLEELGGKKALQAYIDETLDEIIEIRKIIQDLKK